jgi:hypothetical protein
LPKNYVTPTIKATITLLRLSNEEVPMRNTSTGRSKPPDNNTQINLWSDGLEKPVGREDRQERVKRLAEKAITNLAEALGEGKSEALTQYLGAMSRFHRYSMHNVLLIAAQRPGASHVAGFRKWLELERSVMKGEKGIAIFAPMIRKPRGDTSQESGDGPDSDDGARVVRGFRVVYVFDITQTEGKPLPEFARVAGDPGKHLDRLKALTREQGIRLEYASDLGGAYGTSSGGTIRLLRGQPTAEEFSVLAHELAHEMLHHDPEWDRPDSKSVRETEAESVAYVVSSACGLETGTAARDYIHLYRGDKETLASSLQRIQQTSSAILATLLPEE